MTSTDAASGFRPWQFFLIASLVSATAAILLARETQPAALVLLSLVVCSAGCAGFGAYRTLVPFVAGESARWRAQRSSGARAALEREKQLVLRSIKELEFDRAMGKVADRDFDDMRARLRQRALGLMQQLDALGAETDVSGVAPSTGRYRAAIERDLAQLLSEEGVAPADARSCEACGTRNDRDARFCKACGRAL